MSDHRYILNKTALTALLVLTLSPAFCTACVSANKAAESDASAAETSSEETQAGALPDKKDSSGTEDKGHKGSKRTAGGEIPEKDGKTAAETAGEAVPGKNGISDEDEKEEDEAQQPLPEDHMERQKNSQEQVWESEDSEEDDCKERGEDAAVKESGDTRKEENNKSPHIHDWVEQTQTVHHDETGHFEEVKTGAKTVVDEEAYDEPVYQMKCVCSACGYEADSVEEISGHLDSHYDPQLGYIDAGYSVQEVVTDVIHHPESSHEEPVFEEKWIVDSEAWDETVVTGYRCSTCGAVK